MTQAERERFSMLPQCDDCEHPAGHHTRRGCAWCDCGETPAWQPDARGEIRETTAAGIYSTPDGYLITPDALRRMGVREGAVAAVVQRCHDAAGLPHVAAVVLRVRVA